MSSSHASANSTPIRPFQLLTASYDSPTNAPFSHIQKLPAPSTSEPPDRVAYLSVLRKAAAELQAHVNKELTQRMEEDKVREAGDAVAKGKKNGVLDEAKEEENYGEEVVEED